MWVCDSFYQVSPGGHELDTDQGVIRAVFERPTVRDFEGREQAVAPAKTHIRDQFPRLGIGVDPEFYVDTPAEVSHVPAASRHDES